jgi:hypothetical protein
LHSKSDEFITMRLNSGQEKDELPAGQKKASALFFMAAIKGTALLVFEKGKAVICLSEGSE